jgi:hypothetical protein
MGSLALRPGDSLTILLDGFVNRLQDSQFPSFLLFKLRGLDSYPGGTLTHCSCQPSLDAHLSVLISQACLSRHLSEIMDRIAKGPEDVKKSVRAADELP